MPRHQRDIPDKMGPLVGQRTGGGLGGTRGFPVLMDGGSITAPNLAIWTPEEGWTRGQTQRGTTSSGGR